jgi:hypothetical protein
VCEQGWNVLDGDFMPPVMVLKDSALRHNLDEMAAYCRGNSISLAPHVKTHMAPQLFQMQLDAGAWGLTVANISQARVWRAFGAGRVILANELVEPTSVRWVAEELKRDLSFAFYCLVDSVAGVALGEGDGEGKGWSGSCETARKQTTSRSAVVPSSCFNRVSILPIDYTHPIRTGSLTSF